MVPDVECFYEPAGDATFVSTPATAGPWDKASQHAGPPSALIARAFARHAPVDGQLLARVAVDILRPVPVAPLTLRVRTVRPGRRVTLVEGVVEAGGRDVLHARGWRVAVSSSPAVDLPGVVPALPPAADEPLVWPGAYRDGYLSAMEWRFATGALTEPGPAKAWVRARVPLVAGEETEPAGRALLVADSGNGISAWLDPAAWLFVNVDLTVALHRQPTGEWILLDAATTIGPDGTGLAVSRLADRNGWVGRGLQTLVVGPR
jgi:hypothetical protein